LAAEEGDGIYEGVVDAHADEGFDDRTFLSKVDETSNAKDVITTGLSNLNSQYVGPIGVGTVTQCLSVDEGNATVFGSSLLNATGSTCQATHQSQVWVVFDTGSTNIWINSDLCESGPCRLPGRHVYNHTVSETFGMLEVENHVTVQFGTGKIEGPQARDDFHIGPFTVKEQTFAMIQNATGSVFKEVAFEGILGLAFPKMSANGVVPFFDSVIKQKALDHNEFAFYLSKDKLSSNAIFWGGVDKTFYKGELEYFPVVDPFYWSLKLVSFRIGKEEIFRQEDEYAGYANADRKWNGPVAIVDTGTTFFTAEKDKFKSIMEKLPRVKCKHITSETHPPMTITLESASGHAREFVLNHKQYMASNGKGDDAKCSPAFMQVDLPEEHGPGMILGEVFLRHYFAVFDRGTGEEHNARVALAEAADHDDHLHSRLHHLTRGQPSFSDNKAVGEMSQ
jgi:pepsin A